jgi:hypothetical protein
MGLPARVRMIDWRRSAGLLTERPTNLELLGMAIDACEARL